MFLKKILKAISFFLFCGGAFSYQITGDEYFVSAGLGATTNAVRSKVIFYKTPSWQMTFPLQVDYALDESIMAFGAITPSFAGDSIGIGFKPGVKYFWPKLSAPLLPYFSGAVNLSFLFPTNSGYIHTNLGLVPGIGTHYFVLANLLVGIQVDFNHSIAFIKGSRKFELGVTSSFNIGLKI